MGVERLHSAADGEHHLADQPWADPARHPARLADHVRPSLSPVPESVSDHMPVRLGKKILTFGLLFMGTLGW
ncbi:hypothetical protein GCM10027569_53690 [Flindersiella endophytica]